MKRILPVIGFVVLAIAVAFFARCTRSCDTAPQFWSQGTELDCSTQESAK